ncbi:MAG: hypothetical protein Q7R77_00350 [Candidatus Daviesbacteria bacterium]|nr:hypothetical protein [Candidatus Daviesbacteria bacterium]
MPIQELERGYLPTPIHSAEISTIQTLKRVDMYPGLGRDSVLTEETGFLLGLEMDRFGNDLNFALASGKNLVEALNFATDELEVNIRTYNVEFIKSKTVLPHKNRFDVVDGVLRMVGNNGRPVIDAISSQERKGSVLQASRIIESFLLAADLNSFAVIMSPDGWSGYVDQYGRGHNHLNTETMIFWKNQKGILQGLTLITDLDQAQSTAVMRSLGVSEEVLKGENEQERLANIVRNPALLRADTNPFEYVLDKILAVRGRENIRLLQKEGPPEIRSIEQTREEIRKFDELLLFDQKEEELISNLREFIMGRIYQLGDRNIQERVTKEIERTVLSLAGEHLRKNPTIRESFSNIYKVKIIHNPFLQNSDNFGPEIAFLISRAGCPASMAARILRGSSLGAESGGVIMPSTVTLTELKDEDFCIRCGACREYIWCIVRHGQKCPKCPAIREC